MDNSHLLSLDTYLPHMRDVNRCEQSLRELNLTWRMIEASAKMNCPVEARAIIPTMAATGTALADPTTANPAVVMGGIGIVFDGGPEFEAMLRGGLGERSDSSAFYVDRRG